MPSAAPVKKAPSIWQLRRQHETLHPRSLFLQPVWLSIHDDFLANFHVNKHPVSRCGREVWRITRTRPVKGGLQSDIFIDCETLDIVDM